MDNIAFGQVASKGDVTGRICFSEVSIAKYKRAGEKTIFVKKFTVPEDTPTIEKSDGVLTKVGGLLSHAAVSAREYGKPCIINCLGFQITPKGLICDGRMIREGSTITMLTKPCEPGKGYIYYK